MELEEELQADQTFPTISLEIFDRDRSLSESVVGNLDDFEEGTSGHQRKRERKQASQKRRKPVREREKF